MANKIEYVELGANDLDVVGPLWEKLLAHHVAVSKYFGGQRSRITFETRKNQLQEKSQAGGLRIDVVRESGTGDYVGYCITSVNAEDVGEIESIYIEPEYRRSGIGYALMRRALNWLDRHAVKRKILGVGEGNESVFAFYSQFGFYPRTTILERIEP